MTWRAYLGLTMTGEVGRRLDWSSGNLNIALNDIEELSVSVAQNFVEEVSLEWWSPWSGCLLLSYEGDEGEVLMGAGPFIRPPQEESTHSELTLKAQGIGAVLSRRNVSGDFRPGEEEKLKNTIYEWSGVSLGSMVGRLVKEATAKRAGWLPIVISPEEKAIRQRTYEGWNLGNNGVWKRITEISEVIGGPDVMFRPRWVPGSNRTRFEWVLVTGTEAQPTIPQRREVFWDTTAQATCITHVDLTSSVEGWAHKSYVTGTGEGSGIALAIAEKDPDQYVPLLETVIADSDGEGDLLKSKAEAALMLNSLHQFNLGVSSKDQGAFGTWYVGDTVDLQVQDWLAVPSGVWGSKIIGASFALGSDIATVKTQPQEIKR